MSWVLKLFVLESSHKSINITEDHISSMLGRAIFETEASKFRIRVITSSLLSSIAKFMTDLAHSWMLFFISRSVAHWLLFKASLKRLSWPSFLFSWSTSLSNAWIVYVFFSSLFSIYILRSLILSSTFFFSSSIAFISKSFLFSFSSKS